MKKYPVFLQDDYVSCGAYCIYMILHYYNGYVSIGDIKKNARISKNGITIRGIVECLHTYNIESKAYKASLDDIATSVHLPCILHVLSGDYTHYVVLYEIKGDVYIVGDPEKGLTKLTKEQLENIYTKNVIAITHVGRVPEDKKETYCYFLYNTYLAYRDYVLKLIYKGICIALLTYLSSLFFRFLGDDMNNQTHYFYMILLSLGFGSVQLLNTYVSYKKDNEVIKLTRVLDEDYVYESSLSMMRLPSHFFETDHGYIQSELLSFFELSSMSMNIFTRLFLDGTSFVFIFLGMCLISVKMSLIIFVMHVVISMLSYTFYKKMENVNKESMESFYNYQHHLLELIKNVSLIQQYGIERDTQKRSFDIYDKNAQFKEKQLGYTNGFEHIIQGIVYIFYALVMIVGFYIFKKSYLTMGEMLMFYMLISYSLTPMLSLVEMFIQYEKTAVIYEKYKSFQSERKTKDMFNEKITSITFENVSYAYGYSLPLFEHMNCVIDHHTIIKGENGSGKTTFLKLLMGYDENYNGNIYVNKHELRQLDLSSLYKHISYIDGTPTFLHMSVYDNFLCEDQDKIINLLELFGHEELIDMFHIVLNEDGSPLSLGQRQIVALIRAICKDSDVYIFDEAFSHMDSSLVSKVEKYLKKIGDDKIYIEVSHKIKAVKKGWNMITIDNSKKDVL